MYILDPTKNGKKRPANKKAKEPGKLRHLLGLRQLDCVHNHDAWPWPWPSYFHIQIPPSQKKRKQGSQQKSQQKLVSLVPVWFEVRSWTVMWDVHYNHAWLTYLCMTFTLFSYPDSSKPKKKKAGEPAKRPAKTGKFGGSWLLCMWYVHAVTYVCTLTSLGP